MSQKKKVHYKLPEDYYQWSEEQQLAWCEQKAVELAAALRQEEK